MTQKLLNLSGTMQKCIAICGIAIFGSISVSRQAIASEECHPDNLERQKVFIEHELERELYAQLTSQFNNSRQLLGAYFDFLKTRSPKDKGHSKDQAAALSIIGQCQHTLKVLDQPKFDQLLAIGKTAEIADLQIKMTKCPSYYYATDYLTCWSDYYFSVVDPLQVTRFEISNSYTTDQRATSAMGSTIKTIQNPYIGACTEVGGHTKVGSNVSSAYPLKLQGHSVRVSSIYACLILDLKSGLLKIQKDRILRFYSKINDATAGEYIEIILKERMPQCFPVHKAGKFISI